MGRHLLLYPVLALILGAMLAPVGTTRLAPAPTTPQDDAPGGVFGVDADELVLDNGFRIVVVTDRRVPRVAASLWYRVGELQAGNGEHGAAHFLEHAVHQGTTTVGVTDVDGDRALLQRIFEAEQALLAAQSDQRNALRERGVFVDELAWPTTPRIEELRRRLYELEDEQSELRTFWEEYNAYRRAGALYPHTDPVPATTGTEHIDIEVDLPVERLELFFRLEADRMVNAVMRGFEAHRFVVIEQFLGGRNPPAPGRFGEALYGVTGISHPAWQDPGGHLRDFGYYNRASMQRMYDDYFVPNNAVLVLVGAVTVADVEPLARRYFGPISRGQPPLGMDMEAEPPPGGEVRLDWHEPADPRVVVRHRVPGVGHPDRSAFDVMTELLSGADGMAAAALAAQGGPPLDGASFGATVNRYGISWPQGSTTIFDVSGRAQRDEDLPRVEGAILAAIGRVQRGEIDGDRLALAKKRMRLDWQLARSDRRMLASMLGRYTTADDWRTLRTVIEERDAMTPGEIQRVAREYLVPWNRVTGTTRRSPSPVAPGPYLANPRADMRGDAGAGDGGGAR